MACSEGCVDYGSGRYKLVGRAGQEDYYLHAGDWLEVWRETQGWSSRCLRLYGVADTS